MNAPSESTQVYPRNRVLTTLLVVNTVLFAFCGMLNMSGGKALISLIWFFGATVIYVNFIWCKRTPFIQFTEEGLVLSPAMVRPKRNLKWNDIASLQNTDEKKIHLVLKSGERLKIALFSINKEDRIPLVRRLEAQLAHKT